MKNLFKISLVLIAMIAFGANSFGQTQQASATAHTTATIVTAIAIQNTTDMNFGHIAVGDQAGTVVLTPSSTRTATGGCSLPATTGTVSAAQFTVTGASDFDFTIFLPSSVTLDDNNGNSMTVDLFTSNPSGTGTLSGGTADVYVGGTLHVGANQVSGIYESDNDFTLTVQYE